MNTQLKEVIDNNSLEAKIDRFGELQSYLSSFQKEYDLLKKELSAYANQERSSDFLNLDGRTYRMEFSASAEGHELAEGISVAGVLALYGTVCIKADITAIRKYESLHHIHESVLAVKVGSRKLIGTSFVGWSGKV